MSKLENLDQSYFPLGEKLRLSREERDHVAGHALDSISSAASNLVDWVAREEHVDTGSGYARKIAALSNLLGDIGWEREAAITTREELSNGECKQRFLGELFPVVQLRPWLEEWQGQDNEALVVAENALETWGLERRELPDEELRDIHKEARVHKAIADAQTKLGTGAILLARIEKWMASHGN